MSRPDVFCSVADNRSWTDPITNLSAISEANSVAVARQLLAGDLPLPIELFPNLVHEFTHQSFFRTRVFSALAHLRLQATANLLSSARHEAGVKQMAVYERTLTMLRPLAEGAAMFAEFDLTSSLDSEIGSLTLGAALHLFLPPDADQVPGFRQVLSSARSSRAMLNRKVNLLGSPLGSAGGGYSMGYLALKTLWLHATGDTEDDTTWLESDRWLRYVRKFFFEDPGLLIAILDPAGDLDTVTRRIADAVSSRILTFFLKFDPELDLEIFEDHSWDQELLTGNGYVSFAHSAELCEALHITVEDEKRAHALFESTLMTVTKESIDGQLDEFAPSSHDQLNLLRSALVYNSAVGANRLDMRIAALPVQVVIDADDRVTLTSAGEVVLTYEKNDFGAFVWQDEWNRWQPGVPMDGRIDVFIPTNPVYGVVDMAVRLDRLVIISIGDEPVSVRHYDRPAARDPAHLADHAEHAGLVLRARAAFATLDRIAMLGRGTGAETASQELSEMVEEIYFNWAASGLGLPARLRAELNEDVKRRLFEEHDAQLRRTGVLQLFGLDRELIESLALLGLCNSVDPSAAHISRTFTSLGLSVEKFVDRVDEMNASTGIPRMLTFGALAACIV